MSANRDDVSFATFRVSGDALEPSVVTEALGLKPSLSYRKGEIYRAGRRRQREYKGRTGVWYLSTDALLVTPDLEEHLTFLTFLLSARPRGLDLLRDMVRSGEYEASASCFWAGSPESVEPEILPTFRTLMERIGGRIEIDVHRYVENLDRADVA